MTMKERKENFKNVENLKFDIVLREHDCLNLIL